MLRKKDSFKIAQGRVTLTFKYHGLLKFMYKNYMKELMRGVRISEKEGKVRKRKTYRVN